MIVAPGLHGALDEGAQGGPARVGHDLQAQSPQGPLAALDRRHHQERLAIMALPTTLQTRLLAPDPGLIDLDLAVEPAPLGVHHRPAELVQQKPGGLVVQAELLGQLQRGDAGLERGHEIRRGEPDGQGQPGAVEDRPRGDRGLVAAGTALPAAAGGQEADVAAAAGGTAEALRPAGLDEVAQAGFVVGEAAMELTEGVRIVTGGSCAHAPTLHVVVC